MTKLIGQTIEEGYNKFVIRKSQGCWDWKGCCPKNPGYGQFRSMGKIVKAHRASWIIHKGEIPEGLFVCHHCDNKRCSNPDHLFLGTCKDNNLDIIKKNRTNYFGKSRDKNHRTKIFVRDFEKIISLYLSGISQHKISKEFQVSQTTISNVINKSRAVGY